MFCHGKNNNCVLENSNCLYCVFMYSCHADPCAMLTQEGPSSRDTHKMPAFFGAFWA